MSRTTFLLVIALTSGLTGCGQSNRAPVTVAAEHDAEINGQVFVVTRGSQNVKLGLVTVTAHDLEAAEGVTNAWLAEVAERESLHLRASMAVAAVNEETAPLIAEAMEGIAEVDQTYPPPFKGPHKGPAPGDEPIYMRTLEQMGLDDSSIADYRRVAADPFVQQLRWAKAKRATAQRALQRIGPIWRIEDLVGRLPHPLATAQSDADGEFVLRIPARRRVAIFARAERALPTGMEKYLWLIRLPEEARSGTKLLLSNETMASGASPLSLVRIPE